MSLVLKSLISEPLIYLLILISNSLDHLYLMERLHYCFAAMPLNYLDFKRVVKKLLRGQAFCSFVGPACCLIECQDLTFSVSYFIIQDIQQRLHQQSRAFHGLFRQPDRVEELVEIVQRLVMS